MWQMDKRISDSRWSQTVGCKTVRSSITGTPERHKLLRFKIWLHLKTVETFQLFTSVTPSALVFSSLLPHVCIVFLQSCVFPVIFYVLTFISHLCLFFFIQRAGKQMWMTIWSNFYILHQFVSNILNVDSFRWRIYCHFPAVESVESQCLMKHAGLCIEMSHSKVTKDNNS